MAEELARDTQKWEKIRAIFRVCIWIFVTFCIISIAVVITLPVTSLPISEHNPIVRAQDALVGEWGTNCCATFALLSDGKQMGKLSNPIMWTFASVIRFNLASPYYVKNPDTSTCRIVYTRASWFDTFARSCVEIQPTDQIIRAFTDGHAKFVTRAKQAKTLYEKYRDRGLVE